MTAEVLMGTKLLEVLLQEAEVVRAHHRAEVPLLEVVRHRQAEVLHLKVVRAVRQVQALLVARHRAEVLHLEVARQARKVMMTGKQFFLLHKAKTRFQEIFIPM